MNSLTFTSIVLLSLLALACGALLHYIARQFPDNNDPLVDEIEQLLPQSQCAQCGHPGCRPYAEAVAKAGGKINKCAPGGEAVMLKIAEILNIEPQSLSVTADENTIIKPEKKIAFIDENNCIGCTKCIQVCPVEAIVGAKQMLHTVLTDYCTGCDLCVPVCPTDCIKMKPITLNQHWQQLPAIAVTIVESDKGKR